MVQGNALVTGKLLVEGEFLNKSDARRKEAVAALTASEVDACMKVAAGITLHIFKYVICTRARQGKDGKGGRG